jgi:hypothetical protein
MTFKEKLETLGRKSGKTKSRGFDEFSYIPHHVASCPRISKEEALELARLAEEEEYLHPDMIEAIRKHAQRK